MIPTASTIHRFTRDSMVDLDATGLTRAYVAVNEHVRTCDKSGDVLPANMKHVYRAVLHEMITREILRTAPDAAYLRVAGGLVSHCLNTDNTPAEWCDGHPTLLQATDILDEDGYTLATVDPLSPVQFWLERLTPESALPQYLLDLSTRELLDEETLSA